MPENRPVPDNGAEAPAAPECAGQTASRAVDWFGLTESNLPSGREEPPADETPEPEGPSLASIGGLRP